MTRLDKRPKILVIVGPTASGKSDLAVRLAERLNGEVVSADSRQVYRGLDVGTGKITFKEMRGVPHHLLDVASPKVTYTVAKYQRDASRAVNNIVSRGKLPIICGGTGFYIQALVDGIVLPDVLPNLTLRKKLANKTPAILFSMLKKLDPTRAKTIDPQNSRRLIRAIEIAKVLGKVPKLNTKKAQYVPIFIGLNPPPEILRKKIHQRLLTRLGAPAGKNMIDEVRRLHRKGISWQRLHNLGLEYRYLVLFLQKKITLNQLIERLDFEIWHYAKRQLTWFKRDQRIRWFENSQEPEIKSYLAEIIRSVKITNRPE